jgi:hypothetical protein
MAQIPELCKELEPHTALWCAVSDFTLLHDEWMTGNLQALNAESIEEKVRMAGRFDAARGRHQGSNQLQLSLSCVLCHARPSCPGNVCEVNAPFEVLFQY